MESIPTTANNNIGPADLSEDEVVQTLRDDFKQTREFLRLISQLNLKKYIRFEKEADYDEFTRYFYKNVDTRFICNFIASSFWRGFWCRRSDIRRAAPHISDASFNRIMKFMSDRKLISTSQYKKDNRYILVKPTNAFLIKMVYFNSKSISEMLGVLFFLLENSGKENDYAENSEICKKFIMHLKSIIDEQMAQLGFVLPP